MLRKTEGLVGGLAFVVCRLWLGSIRVDEGFEVMRP